MNLRSQELKPWHAIDFSEATSALASSENGLSQADAIARLKEYGQNELPHQSPPTWWQIVLRQFQNPLIYILGIAAVVSVAIGDFKDAGFIAAVLVLNAAIGAYQEWRAEQSAQALQKLLKTRAAVERDGEVREIDADGVVPGDIVWVESGNRVPADLRLAMAYGLEVDESLLTGESLPVAKDVSWVGTEETTLADRLNVAYAGSIVTRGRAKGIVVATGTATSVGQLALDVLGKQGGSPPLLQRMERFTHVVAWVVMIAAVGIGVLGLALGRYELTELFLFCVALVVSAIPEGLPVSMTVALSIATTRMARRGVIVRRLTAVEGLGSCTLVATDKTGTLTCNELTVREIRLPAAEKFDVTGEGFTPDGQVLMLGKAIETGSHPGLDSLSRAAVLCNEADLHHTNGDWVSRGDAVDVALLSMAQKLNWSRERTLGLHPQVHQIPFEPELQFAASHHDVDGQTMVFVKGAPERVLAMCQRHEDDALFDTQLGIAEDMAGRGYRVLALAEGLVEVPIKQDEVAPNPTNLKFLGFVGMIDPLRPGVKDAVKACHDAGIRVCMVTGDHRITALAIARDLGLATDASQVVTGDELKNKSAEQLAEFLKKKTVFARVEPRQKLELVQAARQHGHFVAVTGDGANDAPALRDANIGIAMGKAGTDVAREASELVLSDDNFASIVGGIEEGRIAYDNIRKVIYFLISTGAAELLLMFLAILTGSPLPLLPVQILWLNLVTSGIQDVALAFEPGEGDTLRRKPRPPGERIFNQLMIERTILAAVVIAGVGFGVFSWMLQNGWSVPAARNDLLLLVVLFQMVHVGNCRSETKSAFSLSPLRSPILLAGTAVALLIHVAALYVPLGHSVLGTDPVPLKEWLVLLAMAFVIFPAIEVHKWAWKIRVNRPGSAK